MVEDIGAFLLTAIVILACLLPARLIVEKIFRLIGKQNLLTEEAPKTLSSDFMQMAAAVLVSAIFVGLFILAMRIVNAFI